MLSAETLPSLHLDGGEAHVEWEDCNLVAARPVDRKSTLPSEKPMQQTNNSGQPKSPGISELFRRLRLMLDQEATCKRDEIYGTAIQLNSQSSPLDFRKYAAVLTETCAHLYEFGESKLGIDLAIQVASKADKFSDLQVHRRVANIIGAQYCDIADYASAMIYLERAIKLARELGSPTLEAACLANVIAVLQEMGHYRQAMAMAERVLVIGDNSSLARSLKVQCASIGLFAAHRAGDRKAAAAFLAQGQIFLDESTEPLRRAFFEKNRALYLVDCGEFEQAKTYLAETANAIGVYATPKTKILIAIATSICEWGVGSHDAARTELNKLYEQSRYLNFYHHFVLQALVKVFSNSSSPESVARGIGYARELVEYTTSVKKAKFYRQLASKQESRDRLDSQVVSVVDPFAVARDWLSSTEVSSPAEDSDQPDRRHLAKHEELTAIHEDMAKLRAMSIRRDIRTDAVDTAENWAIAAEFFDDETGQHCYRVGHLATMLAREIGMDETFCVQVEHAARLHDIGKIAVNEVILLKPGPLDASEMAAMRLHTEVGAQILAGSDDPTLKMAVEVARHHHEWWNGAGYPTKLSGKDIPISARVCAYADVYDALTHMRSYKKAWTHERAVEEITRLGGVQFDPDMLSPFKAVLSRYRADLAARAIPGFADMDSNSLIASRKKLMETIAAGSA